MIVVLLGLIALATILYPGFVNPRNLNNLLSQVTPVGVVAVGMTFVIIGGGFDLSVGATYAAASVAFATFADRMPLWAAFFSSILLALVAGVANGLVITRLKVNTFIATLATASLISGLAYLYSRAVPVIPEAEGFGTLGTGKFLGIWVSIFVLVGFLIVGQIVLAGTTYGRSVFAIGGNDEAARLAGMRIDLVRVSTFMISAGCAAVAGMITASQIGVGQATIGPNITLDSIAIVIIGGTSLLGGEGAMWRTAIGILIWGTVTNLFSSLAFSSAVQSLMLGVIVLVAVSFDSFSRRARG